MTIVLHIVYLRRI